MERVAVQVVVVAMAPATGQAMATAEMMPKEILSARQHSPTPSRSELVATALQDVLEQTPMRLEMLVGIPVPELVAATPTTAASVPNELGS